MALKLTGAAKEAAFGRNHDAARSRAWAFASDGPHRAYMSMVMRYRIAAFLTATALSVVARAGAQQRGSDPFAGVRPQDDREGLPNFRGTALERRAVQALDPSGKGFPLWVTTRRLGGHTLIFVRGWEATGTGFGQVGYGVYEPVRLDSVRVVWRGLAAEYSDVGGRYRRAQHPYELWGCLRVLGDRLAYAHSAPPGRGRDVGTPPVPAPGVFAWSDTAARFVRVGALPASFRGACRRPAELLPPAG